QALEYCCLFHHIDLEQEQKEDLMRAYSVLPAYEDVKNALRNLDELDYTQYAFSNGSAAAVTGLLENAGISDLFHGIVSVEATRVFKPNPLVYRYFNEQTNSKKEHSCLISGNPFDVMGAISYGMHAIWVQRSQDTIFDPWEFVPTKTIKQLGELPSVLKAIP
ncbi:MAG TPA: HAD hydrolase-like protein, partial [Eudoraea sp.]|nr:HAD hydrolase-like protein [Eudoraea sp.]